MKTKSIIAISLLVILGFILGFFTAGRLAHNKMQHFREMMLKPNQEKNHIIKRLEIADTQLAEIQPILDSMLPIMQELRKIHNSQMDSTRNIMFEKIKPQLTAVQLKKVERMQQRPTFRPSERNRRQSK